MELGGSVVEKARQCSFLLATVVPAQHTSQAERCPTNPAAL